MDSIPHRIPPSKAARALLAVCLLLGACASIPAEAPELSTELGHRLGAIEAAHRSLLRAYMDEKRARVEDFLQNEWIPRFAAQYFSQPEASALWDQVALEGDEEDRMRYLLLVGPELIGAIDRQRRTMLGEIDALEREILGGIAGEYAQARAINHTLTAFLVSAAELDANRRRYLEVVGVDDQRLADWLNAADAAVGRLNEGREQVEDWQHRADEYLRSIRELRDRIRQDLGGGGDR